MTGLQLATAIINPQMPPGSRRYASACERRREPATDGRGAREPSSTPLAVPPNTRREMHAFIDRSLRRKVAAPFLEARGE